jgi:cell division protein FtsN
VSYRVRVGPYSELRQAQEAAQRILDKSGHPALIMPVQAAGSAGAAADSF